MNTLKINNFLSELKALMRKHDISSMWTVDNYTGPFEADEIYITMKGEPQSLGSLVKSDEV